MQRAGNEITTTRPESFYRSVSSSHPSSFSSSPPSLFQPSFSFRTRVHCARSNGGMREFPHRSCSPCHSLLHPSHPLLRQHICFFFEPPRSSCIFRKGLTSYLLNIGWDTGNFINSLICQIGIECLIITCIYIYIHTKWIILRPLTSLFECWNSNSFRFINIWK